MTKNNGSAGLKIIKLTAANIKTLVAIEINADGKEVILTGKNESGKSSAIDAIMLALNYKAATRSKDGKKRIEKPLRAGQESGIVTVELDNMIITRKFVGENSYIKVTNKEGMVFQTPQKILDNLIGEIAFDPLEFVGLKAEDQAKVLRDLAQIDIADLETQRDELYDDRTLKTRDLTNEQARLDALDEPEQDVPDEEVSAVKLTEELAKFNAMEERNESMEDEEEAAYGHYESALNSESSAVRDVDDLIERLDDAKEKLKTKKEHLISWKKNYEEHKIAKPEVWKGTPNLVDAVNNVEDINAAVRIKKEYAEVKKSVAKYQKTYDKIDGLLGAARDAITKAIESAKYPLKGLTVVDDQVFLDGIIFQDLSDGKKLVASTSIAMALNPDLRCIFARNASLLDEDNLKLLRALGKDKDYQMWIEVVHTDVKSAVKFVNGTIDGQQIDIELPTAKADA